MVKNEDSNSENKQSVRKNKKYLYTAKRSEDGTPVYLVDGIDSDMESFAYPGANIEKERLPYVEEALPGKVSYTHHVIDTQWGLILKIN